MQRDSRIGKEHWRGCHSFKNIICDGDLAKVGSVREGGLKMGGTYWYYVSGGRGLLSDQVLLMIRNWQYQLDDDIEFHNSAEPSTTSCPLLPGQLVNVLHVPFHFSGGGGRDRNGSVSSTSSELRTMDPEMKFLNPRPAPPPKLPRLKTSPPLAQLSDAFDSSPSSFSPLSVSSESTGRSFSQPSSATSQRKQRLPVPKAFENWSDSTSPTKQNGFLATLKQLAARATDLDRIDDRTPRARQQPPVSTAVNTSLGRTPAGRVNQHPPPSSRGGSRERSPGTSVRVPQGPPIRAQQVQDNNQVNDTEDGLSSYLYQVQRRNRSRSRDPSPLRNSLVITAEQESELSLPNGLGFRPAALDTLQEALSPQNSPKPPLTAKQDDAMVDGSPRPVDQNKRLPTLPNSPSSAYEASPHTSSPSRSIDEDALQSHFSALTISTTVQSPSLTGTVNSMFDFTEDPVSISLSHSWTKDLPEGPSTNGEEINAFRSFANSPTRVSSMPQTPKLENQRLPADDVVFPSESSSSSIDSHDAECRTSVEASLQIESRDGSGLAERRRCRDLVPPHLFQYRLPLVDDTSTEDKYSKAASHVDSTFTTTYSSLAIRRQDSVSRPVRPGISQSTSMQQLMEELSYLGDMINT